MDTIEPVSIVLPEAELPGMALACQSFDKSHIEDVRDAVYKAMAQSVIQKVQRGETVAVTAGSRGIDRIDEVTAAVCEALKEIGARPFIVPAMGSHGKATPEGQLEVLEEMGITEDSMNVEIRATMETAVLGTIDHPKHSLDVHLGRHAAEADHIVVVNRVKSHTKFKGRVESGLSKMLAVGLGKHAGALAIHAAALDMGMELAVTSAARMILEKASVAGGIALVENGYGKLHTIAPICTETWEEQEAELLEVAKDLAAKLPFSDIDLLIVDEIGKNISGTGMDTNVTGRNRDILGDFSTTPRIKRIFVRNLSEETKGNALGIGFADFTTTRVVQAMDYAKTVTNALTGISPEKAAVPIFFGSDREAINAALISLGNPAPQTVRVVRIAHTGKLDKILISHALASSVMGQIRVLEHAEPMEFDDQGNLKDMQDCMEYEANTQCG